MKRCAMQAAAEGDMEWAQYCMEPVGKPRKGPAPNQAVIALKDTPEMRDARRRHNQVIKQAAAARLSRSGGGGGTQADAQADAQAGISEPQRP